MPDPWNIVYCHRYNILIIKENLKTRSQCMQEISSSMGNRVDGLDVYSDSLFIQVSSYFGPFDVCLAQAGTCKYKPFFLMIV